jgi:hypothetical protein
MQVEEEKQFRMMKQKVSNLELQKENNIKELKNQYSDFLSNQMKEKEYEHEMFKREKQQLHDEIVMKHKLLRMKDERDKFEKLENQLAYRG